MHKPSLSSVVVLLLTTSIVSASNICTYTSRACLGSYGCCNNIPENNCCYWPNNYGWSVKFENTTSSPWVGNMFATSACLNRINGVGSSSTSDICTSVFDGRTYLNWLSANWNASTLTSRDDANCVRPNVIGFTTEDGTEHLVKVPEGKFDEVNEWVKTDSFSKLLQLDSF